MSGSTSLGQITDQHGYGKQAKVTMSTQQTTLAPNRPRLEALLRENSLLFGDFTLRSGKKSTFYFDSKRTTLLPEGALLGWLQEVGWPGDRERLACYAEIAQAPGEPQFFQLELETELPARAFGALR